MILSSSLIVGTIGSLALSFLSRGEKGQIVGRNVFARVKAWWGMVAIFLLTLVIGTQLSILIWIFLSFFALREYVSVFQFTKSDKRTFFWVYGFILPFNYWLVWSKWYALFSVFIPVYAFIIVPLRSVLADDHRDFLARTAKIQWGLMICVYFVSHAPALYMLEIPEFLNKNGFLLFFVFVVVEFGDVVGYLLDQVAGARKILPNINPDRTVLGVGGRIVLGTALGTSLYWVTPFSVTEAGCLAFVLSVMAIGGDLTMSAVKRDGGQEVSATLVEDGVLDRIDSLCFALPIFFHLTRYFFVL
jgi:phosphatidate cytidylyltransferase